MDKIFDKAKLADLYDRVSRPEGVEIWWLQDRLGQLFSMPRSKDDRSDNQLGRRPWKLLVDEIAPVSRWLRAENIAQGRIRLALNSSWPDALLWHAGVAKPHGIEVTVAMGRERHHLATELVRCGSGRGFIGIPDNAHEDEFQRAIAEPRRAYSTDEAVDAVLKGILLSLSNKALTVGANCTLLVDAPLHLLPRRRWDALLPLLIPASATLTFSGVFVVGGRGEDPWCLRLK